MIFATYWSGYTCTSTAHDVILSFHDVTCFSFLCINICFIWLCCILSFYLILCIYEFSIAYMLFYYIILAKKNFHFLDWVAYNGLYLSWKTFMLLSIQCIRPLILFSHEITLLKNTQSLQRHSISITELFWVTSKV
jgi:hypothetical protein